MTVDLPHTWRPLGVRLAVVFFGAVLAVVFLFAWFAFDQEVRDTYTPFQLGTLTFMIIGGAAVGYGVARARIDATAQGLVIVNGFRRYEVPWEQAEVIRLPSGAPWARLRLTDGTVHSVTALQGSDGARATRGVAEIQGLIEQHRASGAELY
ncbi:PH domain-containing protein [Nocardioides daphniae]|uniref:PH domain-containing protein n=1 Tax=Nocardioides daphniae TaxID=402297 RepID=UPI001665207B|nr:PH domain-containing protein [Nocardioides daphniae]